MSSVPPSTAGDRVPFERIEIGDVTVTALLDLDMDYIPISEAFPGSDAEALLAEDVRYGGVHGHGGVWRLRVRAWVVDHPDGTLLMDTGVGGPWSPAMEWAASPGVLLEAMHEASVDPTDIDIVAISHVHDDHIGGTVDQRGHPTFPYARHLIQRADWDWAGRLASRGGAQQDRDIWDRLLVPLQAAKVLDLVEGDVALTHRLELRLAPGHTPGHQTLKIVASGEQLLLTADVFNHPMQMANPARNGIADVDHRTATETRRGMLRECFSEPGTLIAPAHFAQAFGHVTSETQGEASWNPQRGAFTEGPESPQSRNRWGGVKRQGDVDAERPKGTG